MVSEAIDDSKETAQSHTPRTPPLSAALGSFTDPSQAPVDDAAANGAGEAPVDDDGLDLSLMKKKKKKSKKTEEGEEPAAAEDANDGDAAAAGGEEGALDLTLKKKKKKKVPKEGDDDFAKKLEALQLEGKEGEEPAAAAEDNQQDGDMDKGTGIWEHDETKIINYEQLLSRFFVLLTQKNPDHASSGTKSYKIPPPQCLREGNKKTIFANIADICKRMKRTEEHVTAYLFSELGTSGSVDGSRRLVIKGRFQQKQIENVLRKYISKCHPQCTFSCNGASLTCHCQSNTSRARPAARRIPSSTRERTGFTSSPATRAARVGQCRPSRPVSPPRSVRERRCRVKLVRPYPSERLLGGFMSAYQVVLRVARSGHLRMDCHGMRDGVFFRTLNYGPIVRKSA